MALPTLPAAEMPSCAALRLTLLAMIVLLVQATTGSSQERQKPIPPWERRDVLGRPIPWGQEVRGQRVCLWMPSTRLLYGQPIDLRVETAQTTDQPPYLRLDWDGPRRSIYLEWTTEHGEPVTFTRNAANFRLQPTGKFARGQHLVPGKYRARAVIDSQRIPADPLRWLGRAESNTVEFVVFASDERGRAQLVPEVVREKTAKLVPALGDEKFETRDAAERALLKLGFEILPMLEPALESPSAEARLRARRVFGKLTAPLFEERFPIQLTQADQMAALLAVLGDASWQALRDQLPAEYVQSLRDLRVAAALIGPVELIPEGELPAQTRRRLIEDLNSEESHRRATAVRAAPRTADKEVLTALAARIADPYQVYAHFGVDPYPVWPIADEAGSHSIPWQGKAILDPLLALARQQKDHWIRRRIYAALAMIGPDPRSLEFVRARVGAADRDDLPNAVGSLATFGRDTVPDLIKLAEAGKQIGQNPNLPRVALEQLAHHGDAQSIGPFLMKMLRHPDPEMVGAAIQVAEKVGLREALPELKRRAQDDAGEQNVQAWAISAYARMANRQDAADLLLERLGSKNASTRGIAAFLLGAIEHREAVPRILDLLSDREWYVRAQSDQALRGLAQRPEGVGYDAYRPDAALWRKWWKQP